MHAVVTQPCNPSTQKAQAGWRVRGQPGLHSETLCPKKKKVLIELSLGDMQGEPTEGGVESPGARTGSELLTQSLESQRGHLIQG
jgi:hypothetical protein